MAVLTFAKKPADLVPKDSLRFLLHKHLACFEPGRPLKRVHASELTKDGGLCPRYYALHDLTGADPKDRWLTTSENMTYRLGHALQREVTHIFADMGKVMAHWRCQSCKTLYEFQKKPAKCQCGCKAFEAEEVRFESAVNGASCGVDMLFIPSGPKLKVTELKTMAADEFKTLVAPLAEHKLRTGMYLRLIEESKHPWSNLVDTKEATILYISKSAYGNAAPDLKSMGLSDTFSPFKEFPVGRNDKDTTPLLHPAKVVKQFRDKKIGMPCGVCATAMSKRAQGCGMRKACFSGQFPGEHEWQK